MRPAVDRIGQYRDRQLLLRVDAGPRDVTLKAAGVTEPVPAAARSADRAEAVILLRACVRIAPVSACHFAAAGRGQDTLACRRRKLGKITRDICRGSDESRRRCECVRWIVTRDDDPAAEQDASAVTAREGCPAPQWYVGRCFGETRRIDDFALDPSAIGLTRDRLDDHAEQAVPVIGIFKA